MEEEIKLTPCLCKIKLLSKQVKFLPQLFLIKHWLSLLILKLNGFNSFKDRNCHLFIFVSARINTQSSVVTLTDIQ
jgi:hypothetical protein